MNILIIGGLLLVALLAIVGIVFLSMGEQRTQRARANNNGNAYPAAAPTVSTPNITPATPEVTVPPDRSVPIRQAYPSDKPARANEGDSIRAALNGQFTELASELRSLYQEAWDLEQRLRGLTNMLDRIEDRHNRVHIEEEETMTHPTGDNSTM
ncbi:MAG TPA: hypothetical protein VFA41_02415 [Ktedonobacteraceae bacterium]|jgi:hypothetical protein|nr:hypothetical protein [Ktedonobacteraceae bacterium]